MGRFPFMDYTFTQNRHALDVHRTVLKENTQGAPAKRPENYTETRLPIAVITKVQGAPLLPARKIGKFFNPLLSKKNRDTLLDVSVKSYYDFLRRHYPHQVKGSKLSTSSQPDPQAPLFLYLNIA